VAHLPDAANVWLSEVSPGGGIPAEADHLTVAQPVG
jgi:hypothetical protein